MIQNIIILLFTILIIISIIYTLLFKKTNTKEGMKSSSCDSQIQLYKTIGDIKHINSTLNTIQKNINKFMAEQSLNTTNIKQIQNTQQKLKKGFENISKETEQNRKKLDQMIKQSKQHLSNSKQTLNNLNPP